MSIVWLFVMLWTILAPMPGIGLECKPLQCKCLAAKQGSSGDGGGAPGCPGQHKSPGRCEARRRDWVEKGKWRSRGCSWAEDAHCGQDGDDQALQKGIIWFQAFKPVLTIIFMIKLLGRHCFTERWLRFLYHGVRR